MCSAPAFCAWRRLPLICLKLLVGVCVRDGLVASVCVYRASAASVELLPRAWRAVAFPLWLHVRSCSTWLTISLMVRCCLGACVYETGLLLVCACRTSAASVEPLPRGSRAVAFPRSLHEFKLLDVARIVRFSHQLFLLCFGFIGANSNTT